MITFKKISNVIGKSMGYSESITQCMTQFQYTWWFPNTSLRHAHARTHAKCALDCSGTLIGFLLRVLLTRLHRLFCLLSCVFCSSFCSCLLVCLDQGFCCCSRWVSFVLPCRRLSKQYKKRAAEPCCQKSINNRGNEEREQCLY